MPSLILVIPSIDIKNGRTARVVQGIPDLDCQEYGDDPVEMAMIWRAENAKCIQVIDYDAIHAGRFNISIIEKICSSVVIPIQVGGGIRSFENAQRLYDAGVYRTLIGSLALENKKEFEKILNKFGPQKVAVAIDVIDEEVVIRGRKEKTGVNALELANGYAALGAERFLITDVKTNGMLSGPNVELSKKIAKTTGKKITLSGGVRDKDDLFLVQQYAKYGVDSVVVGRALYENKFPCQRLWRIAESGIFN